MQRHEVAGFPEPEARIVTEDAEHLTLRITALVTIEKAWIARNLCFLAALADHSVSLEVEHLTKLAP